VNAGARRAIRSIDAAAADFRRCRRASLEGRSATSLSKIVAPPLSRRATATTQALQPAVSPWGAWVRRSVVWLVSINLRPAGHRGQNHRACSEQKQRMFSNDFSILRSRDNIDPSNPQLDVHIAHGVGENFMPFAVDHHTIGLPRDRTRPCRVSHPSANVPLA